MFSRESLENPVVLLGLAVLVLAVVTVASSSGRFILALLHNATLDNEPLIEARAAGNIDASKIVERNFFGLASDKPVIEVDTLPETKLELTLRGAFAAAKNQTASAIIEENNREVAETYNVGDSLPGGVTLSAVYPDRVVLSRSGLLETLYFPDDFGSEGVGTRTNQNASRTSTTTPADDSEASKRRDAIRERIRQLRNKR